MGSSRLPDRIPIPGAQETKEKVQGFGILAGVASVATFFMGAAGFGLIAATACILLLWIASKIRTHKEAFAEGKAYR